MFSMKEIARLTGGSLHGEDRPVRYFLHDSRALLTADDTIFVALVTAHNDGHRYITPLAAQGVKCFLVSDAAMIDAGSPVSFVLVPDTLRALQHLAAAHRQKFSLPVIGVTGSFGKTMVKEWLYQLLKDDYVICRSPRSYNSQVGVPLSVLALRPEHSLAIFEAGISKPGEMEPLAQVIRPTIGVFSGLGAPHDESFPDRMSKLTEKWRLFATAEMVISNGQPPGNGKARVIVVGDAAADITSHFEEKAVVLRRDGTAEKFDTPFSDAASLADIATCIVVCMQLGIPPGTIRARVCRLQPVALRLEVKKGIHNTVLINDYYSSDLDSLQIALNHLRQQRMDRKIVVLSDIEQSGLDEETLYARVAELVRQAGVDRLVGVGPAISARRGQFNGNAAFYHSTTEAIDALRRDPTLLSDAAVLLKGARSFGFERIAAHLQLKSHDTVLEIDLDNLVANVNHYRSMLQPGVKIMAMVKAMGYGSGGVEIARTLQHHGIGYLAVAYADEGLELREGGVTLPVMVMSPEEDAFDDIIAYRLEPEIYSFRELEAFVKKLDAAGVAEPYPVHIKFDTGMHRLGFDVADAAALAQRIAAIPNVAVRSVFSHLAASDSPQLDDFTGAQLNAFSEAVAAMQAAGPFLRHICNSGGISRFPQAHFEMVRLGIGMFGVGVDAKEQRQLQLVTALRSRISQLRRIPAGDTVGYSRKGRVEKDSVIAVVPIGYADGFSRLCGNGRHGLYVRGVFCRTVGNICMDMCMVDVTGITCNEGDAVVVFESAGQLLALAEAMQTIPYEVLTSVSGRVKRVYLRG